MVNPTGISSVSTTGDLFPCTYCKQHLPREKFYWYPASSKSNGQRYSRCHKCRGQARIDHYLAHNEPPLCACGCGLKVNVNTTGKPFRFLAGHFQKFTDRQKCTDSRHAKIEYIDAMKVRQALIRLKIENNLTWAEMAEWCGLSPNRMHYLTNKVFRKQRKSHGISKAYVEKALREFQRSRIAHVRDRARIIMIDGRTYG